VFVTAGLIWHFQNGCPGWVEIHVGHAGKQRFFGIQRLGFKAVFLGVLCALVFSARLSGNKTDIRLSRSMLCFSVGVSAFFIDAFSLRTRWSVLSWSSTVFYDVRSFFGRCSQRWRCTVESRSARGVGCSESVMLYQVRSQSAEELQRSH